MQGKAAGKGFCRAASLWHKGPINSWEPGRR